MIEISYEGNMTIKIKCPLKGASLHLLLYFHLGFKFRLVHSLEGQMYVENYLTRWHCPICFSGGFTGE